MLSRIRARLTAGHIIATVALFLALGGTAYAGALIGSAEVQDNSLQSVDLKDNAGVKSVDVVNDSEPGGGLRGQDIIESQLGKVPDANNLDGADSAAFLRSEAYKNESPVAAGTNLNDGTFTAEAFCLSGDRLLSGGPANVNPTSTMVESFPSPGSTTGWKARINKNGQADNFSVVVLCANQ